MTARDGSARPPAGSPRPSAGPPRRLASPARRLALRVLYDVDARGAYANLALDEALESSALALPDRALATELVYGVSRWRLRLDYVLDRLSSRPVVDLPAWIRNILRLGLYQLMFLERVPERAAVSESVALAWEHGHRGTAGLVNAVLREAARMRPDRFPLPAAACGGEGPVGGAADLAGDGVDPAYRLAVEYSHPEWLVRRWLRRYGELETVRRLNVDNEPAPFVLRANLLRTSREELLGRLVREGARAEAGRLYPEAVVYRAGPPIRTLRSYREGLFTVMDEGAMAPARALAPEAGWLVVDACAGAGGKATHLAELMNDKGRIVALDLHPHKLGLLRDTAARLGLHSIETREGDARELPGPDLRGRADGVLVDAPCSGLGVLRRRPDLRWRVREEDLPNLASLQAAILKAAAGCVRPGGVLVYATCTTEPEENEGIVEGFLDTNLEFRRDSAAFPGGRDLVLAPESGGPDGFYTARLIRETTR